ncbi:MAG: hypothetical protein DRR19_28800 [Candidatus Parabeggiatoa sp. nov. 1]|nr:MAG: hypothetical protein DRR19_28800 [Gammaproteobacteria bacterium]
MDYKGTFVPPAFGNSRVPFNIAGPGLLKINEDHIYFEGYKSSSGCFISALALLVLFFGFGSIIFLDTDPNVVGITIAVTILGLMGYKRKFKAKKPVSYEIPWVSVKKYHHKDGVVVFQIVKFKPKGDIYFAPENNCDELLSHLKSLAG